tara:strand:- start:319 stop:708 length:390 start_codon:yes stop_codon:yes gene_type:complete
MAAIIGMVARVLKTTVIWVSVVAKLNEILLVPEDNNRSKNGIETAFLNSVLISLMDINNHIDNKVIPINAPRDIVSPQPSKPDSLIKSVSGVIIRAPNNAKPIPKRDLFSILFFINYLCSHKILGSVLW